MSRMELRYMLEVEIFAAAIELESPEQRSEYVRQACGEDAALAAHIQELLASYVRAGDFMRQPAPGLETISIRATNAELPGTQVGVYELLETIGEGGMGVVYVAEQREPVQRRVALKLIKPGIDSPQIIARFEAERQALARMEHSNIARVLDVGTTHSGRPYFVMELVQGVPITQYCDDLKLTPRERVELFVPVCQAIQHAHQKGIIHRDIKPSNVLVTVRDDRPVPKVIDFGIAKATEHKLTDRSLFTQFGTMVGTLEYMSPEQAELSPSGVDTRSDIYSLGALLYELLTGSTPLTKQEMQGATYAEILRIIKDVEPSRPSVRLSEPSQPLPAVASLRTTEPLKLVRKLRGELDWIVMKCLEKDRNRRYATANGLAVDLERYLADEPVQACPPSAWYRVSKLARRNKKTLLALASTALLALLTIVNLVIGNARIRQEQARTNNQKLRAEDAQRLAQDRAREVQQGLDGLKAANALLDRGRWYASEQRWDDAQAAFSKAIQLRPDHVSAWVERGNLYAYLGLWDLAAVDFVRDTELREPDTPARWYQRALLCAYVDNTEGYRQACRKMHERFRGTPRIGFVEELVRASVLVPNPEANPDFLVKMSQEVVRHQTWSSFSHYVHGVALYRAGQDEEAARQLQEALTYTDWNTRLLSYPVLAMAYHRLGRATDAEQALKEAARVVDLWTAGRSPSPEKYWVLHHGAEAVWPVTWWDWLEYQVLYREARLEIDGVPPSADPRLHVLRARSLAGLRWNDQAEVEYAKALELQPQDLQAQFEAHRNRGYCLVGRRQFSKAAEEFSQAVGLQPDDSYLWRFQIAAHLAAGDLPAYRDNCARMVDRFEKTDDPVTAANLLLVCVLRGDAVPDFSQLLPLMRASDQLWYWGAWVRGALLYRAGKFDEAVQCFGRVSESYRLNAWDWCFLAMAHQRLGDDEQASRCLASAAQWIDEANAPPEASSAPGEDDPTGTRPAWGHWQDSLLVPLLYREAQEVLAKG